MKVVFRTQQILIELNFSEIFEFWLKKGAFKKAGSFLSSLIRASFFEYSSFMKKWIDKLKSSFSNFFFLCGEQETNDFYMLLHEFETRVLYPLACDVGLW